LDCKWCRKNIVGKTPGCTADRLIS
jgi:hypothetical protein